jgi:protein-S-isoprenylcysteine O-methyltransferase Ste14
MQQLMQCSKSSLLSMCCMQATKFLRSRVVVEEQMLLQMFGNDYEQYAKRHRTCIPTVQGCIPFSSAR